MFCVKSDAYFTLARSKPLMSLAAKLEKLRELSDEELVALHDQAAANTTVGIQYYLDELNRRSQNKHTEVMLHYTKQMLRLTVFVAVLTVVNVIAVLVPLL